MWPMLPTALTQSRAWSARGACGAARRPTARRRRTATPSSRSPRSSAGAPPAAAALCSAASQRGEPRRWREGPSRTWAHRELRELRERNAACAPSARLPEEALEVDAGARAALAASAEAGEAEACRRGAWEAAAAQAAAAKLRRVLLGGGGAERFEVAGIGRAPHAAARCAAAPRGPPHWRPRAAPDWPRAGGRSALRVASLRRTALVRADGVPPGGGPEDAAAVGRAQRARCEAHVAQQ